MWHALLGCATLGTFQSARPIDPHTVEVGLEASTIGTRAPGRGHESTSPVGVSVRFGLDPRTELQVRAGFTAPELQLKRLVSAPDRAVAVSVAPSVGGYTTDLHGIDLVTAYGKLPLLIGLPTGRALEWVVSPKLLWGVARHRELPVWGAMVSAGVSAGCSVRLARGVHLMPDAAIAYPLGFVGTGLVGAGGGLAVQGGAAVRVGGEGR